VKLDQAKRVGGSRGLDTKECAVDTHTWWSPTVHGIRPTDFENCWRWRARSDPQRMKRIGKDREAEVTRASTGATEVDVTRESQLVTPTLRGLRHAADAHRDDASSCQRREPSCPEVARRRKWGDGPSVGESSRQ